MKKLLILFVMVISIQVSAQESVLLRLNYKTGETYMMDMKMSQDMGTMMSMDMTLKMNQKITAASGDTYESTMKVAQITMDMSQGGMNVSYDSSKSEDELDPSAKMMQAQMGPMLKSVITVKGNTLGEILETVAEPNIPGVDDFANQSSNVIYPKEAVKVGDTWTMNKSDKGMVMDFTYTVASISSANVKVDVAGKVSGAAQGTISGAMDIDTKTGVPSSSSIVMDMQVQGQQLKTSVTATMTKQ